MYTKPSGLGVIHISNMINNNVNYINNPNFNFDPNNFHHDNDTHTETYNENFELQNEIDKVEVYTNSPRLSVLSLNTQEHEALDRDFKEWDKRLDFDYNHSPRHSPSHYLNDAHSYKDAFDYHDEMMKKVDEYGDFKDQKECDLINDTFMISKDVEGIIMNPTLGGKIMSGISGAVNVIGTGFDIADAKEIDHNFDQIHDHGDDHTYDQPADKFFEDCHTDLAKEIEEGWKDLA